MLLNRCRSLNIINKRSLLPSKSYLQSQKFLIRNNSTNANDIIDECLKLRSMIQPINDQIRGPLDKQSAKNTMLPFVFLLGNHSSGKSSFVNYVFQRKVQTSGVAPTDDNFTVLVPGPSDNDRDGPAFISDPDLGFSGLRSFGPSLIHHTQLKIRSNTAVQDFAIVDSPGMIDSPRVRTANGQELSTVMDRGYDFEGVCKWLAQRADVILLFFDPDKPGTTGETLSILTNSLAGMDHKLYIILNKADQFHKMSDFARAYGSLCWNLSKVIPRKDLPRIYTMCLPPSSRATTVNKHNVVSENNYNNDSNNINSSNNNSSSRGEWNDSGLMDLEATREDVVKEVLSAPKRRVLNEISRLSDDVQLLQLHYMVVNDVVSRYRSHLLTNRIQLFGIISASIGAVSGGFYLELPLQILGGIAGTSGILSLFGAWWTTRSLEDVARRLTQEESLDSSFRRCVSPQDRHEADEYSKSMWQRVKEQMLLNFRDQELSTVATTSNDLNQLSNILETDIPQLRRAAAPDVAVTSTSSYGMPTKQPLPVST